MADLDERLSEARRALEAKVPPADLWARVIEKSMQPAASTTHDVAVVELMGRPRRRGAVGLLAAVALVLVVALLVALVRAEDQRIAKTVTADEPARDRAATEHPVSDHWETMATSPLTGRSPATSVWTGDELIVWRGWRMPATACEQRDVRYCSDPPLTDSAAYRPSTDTWRMLPRPPTGYESAVDGDAAVWTGTEMIVWGGGTFGAAYDPTSNRWRSLQGPPFGETRDPFTMTWTGREVVLIALEGVAAYDPVADTWTRLPSLAQPRWGHQAIPTPGGLLVFGGRSRDRPTVDTIELLAPRAHRWQTIGTGAGLIEAAAAWTGHVIVVVGRTDFDDFTAATVDPSTGTWTPISRPPLEGLIAPSLVWTGTEAVLIGNGRRSPVVPDQRLAVAWNPTTGGWRTLPEADDLTARSGAAAAWTGSELVVWGGFVSNVFTVGEPIADGGRYTPPAA